MRRGMPMRALSMTVTALATVAATLGSPVQTLRARKNRQHPFYWASIQAGEWASFTAAGE